MQSTVRKKDGGCTFYHNTLRTKLSPLRYMERYGLMAVVPTLTALLLSSLNDLQFFVAFLYALLEFRVQSIIGKCTSRHLFSYGGLWGVTLNCVFRPSYNKRVLADLVCNWVRVCIAIRTPDLNHITVFFLGNNTSL